MKKYMIEQKGRSMIEMLGVLAIVGVLSVAGIAGYSKAMSKYKTNKVIDEIATMAANTKTMFAGQGDYSDLDGNGTAYDLGLFPEEMTKACTAATKADCEINGLGGAVEVARTGTAGSSFYIIMKGLTTEACVALVTSDWGGASGFRYLIASATAANVAAANLTHALPTTANSFVKPSDGAAVAFTYATTAGVCDGAGSTNSVGLVFY